MCFFYLLRRLGFKFHDVKLNCFFHLLCFHKTDVIFILVVFQFFWLCAFLKLIFFIGCFPICLVFVLSACEWKYTFTCKFCVAKLMALLCLFFHGLSIVMEWSFCFSITPKLKSSGNLSFWQWTVKLILQLTFPFLCGCQGPFSFIQKRTTAHSRREWAWAFLLRNNAMALSIRSELGSFHMVKTADSF